METPEHSPRTPQKLQLKLPEVKKIPSASAIVAVTGARLFMSASGIVTRACVNARQGLEAVAPPGRHPGPAQKNVLEHQYIWTLGSIRGE